MVVISSGKGDSGVVLGTLIAEALRAQVFPQAPLLPNPRSANLLHAPPLGPHHEPPRRLAAHTADACPPSQKFGVTPLEPMLRHSVLASSQCSLDDFYGQTAVAQGGGQQYLATHASSG